VLDAKDQVESEQAIQSLKISLERLLSEFPEFTQIKEGNLTGSGLAKIVHANEDLIHSVMFYITLQLKSLSKFGTEVYLGGGRADIVFIDEENNKAAVIELKYCKETAQNAIEQIKEKEYAKKFIETWDTILIGISVSGKKEINIAYEEVFKDKNFSGEGTNKDDNSYDLPYSEWFNKYYSEGIEKILQLRINELKPDLKEKISVLPARYQLKSGNTDIKKLIEAVNQLDITENSLVLIPYNIGNKHWVGLILRKTDSFEVVYIDPENNPIDSALLLDLEQSLGIEKHNFQQKLVVKQKYNNCGSELIENFIYHLTGNRIEESEAVIHHSYLMEMN
jgi:ribosomal protein L25 (general stress protein Ctc)